MKKWDSSRNIRREEIYKDLSLRRKESLYSRIALTTFEKDQYFLPQRTLESYIANFIQHLPNVREDTLEVDSEAILKAIEAQHGIFVERARGIYSFSHLTFQEYYAAKYLSETAKKGDLEALVVREFTNDKWREVLLIISGMLDNADDFLSLLGKQAQLLPDEMAKLLLGVVKRSIERQGPLCRYFSHRETFSASVRASIFAFALARILDRDREHDMAQLRIKTFEIDAVLGRSPKTRKDWARIMRRVRGNDRSQSMSRAESRSSVLDRALNLLFLINRTRNTDRPAHLHRSTIQPIDLDFDQLIDKTFDLDNPVVAELNEDLSCAIAEETRL